MLKNLDETVRLQSEIRQEGIRKIRREKLQGIAEGVSSATRLASSSSHVVTQEKRVSGIDCSLMEKEEGEDSSCQICHRD